MAPRRVVIIGGGLAGMTVAKELLGRGIGVLILEAGTRLGGKVGADVIDGVQVEHGYHVFPGWYLNTRQLLRDLGIDGHLVDMDGFYHLKKGEFPNFIAFHAPSSVKNVLKNISSGLVPLPEAVLAVFFGVDLASQAFSQRAYLDRVSANGFLWSRFYATERLAVLHQQTVLQTSAVPNYEVAAMTIQKLWLCGFGIPAPIFSIMNGNLQETFIDPFERFLRQHGAEIQLQQRVRRLEVNEAGRVCGLNFDDGRTLSGETDDVFVLATPLEVTRDFADDELCAAEDAKAHPPDDEACLSELTKLRAAHMAAMDVYCSRQIPHLPRGHVTLYESRYGLSFIDVSQIWPGVPHTRLCMIASDFEPLRALPDPEIKKYLMAELQRYVPEIHGGDIERCVLHPNLTAPLFINTVGAWAYRPGTRTRLANLYIAGDYCRSEADLATMESTVCAALSTARDLLRNEGMGASDGPLRLKIPARKWLLLAKYLALPVVGPIGLCYWARRRAADSMRQLGIVH